jgi:hypothetical protein
LWKDGAGNRSYSRMLDSDGWAVMYGGGLVAMALYSRVNWKRQIVSIWTTLDKCRRSAIGRYHTRVLAALLAIVSEVPDASLCQGKTGSAVRSGDVTDAGKGGGLDSWRQRGEGLEYRLAGNSSNVEKDAPKTPRAQKTKSSVEREEVSESLFEVGLPARECGKCDDVVNDCGIPVLGSLPTGWWSPAQQLCNRGRHGTVRTGGNEPVLLRALKCT